MKFLEGIGQIERMLEDVKLRSSIDSQTNIINSLFNHLGIDPDKI
jgi:hypothetical protein